MTLERQCIDDFCMKCRHNDEWLISQCDQPECPLYEVRPNQAFCGITKQQLDPDTLASQVEMLLDVDGLKLMLNKAIK